MRTDFFVKNKDKSVKCTLCSHFCTIRNGKTGICGVRENKDGELVSLVYGKAISLAMDPIEKKPLFHFLPGSSSLSTATAGCNFKCTFCQNHSISQVNDRSLLTGKETAPEKIVEAALKSRAASISYTYTEPTVFFEYAYDTGVLAREKRILNVFVSNGFMSPEAAKKSLDFLDAINIDLKAFQDKTYKETSGGRLSPVLENIRFYSEHNVWVEVTTLLVPGLNDTDDEIRQIAEFIASVSPAIPWHVSRFHPTYKMMDRSPTPVERIMKALEIGKEAGLRFVYGGNIHGSGTENTICPKCGALLVERYGFTSEIVNLEDGECTQCGETIEGRW